MSSKDIFISTAILSTKEKTTNRLIECGKIGGGTEAESFLFYIVDLPSPQNSTVTKKILAVLHSKAKDNEGFSADLYEDTLSEINRALGKLSQTSDNIWVGKLNAVVGLIDRNEILISQAGNVIGYIFRKNKISGLTESPDPNLALPPSRTFTDITSGSILAGDQIIFGSSELFNRISVDRLRTIAQMKTVGMSALELKRYLRRTHPDGIGAIFISALEEPSEDQNQETIYLDEIEDSALKAASKKIAPTWNKIRIGAQGIWRDSSAGGNKLADKWHKSWREKVEPESKRLFKSGKEKISQSLKSGQHKITELSYGRDNPSRLKIKAVPYQKKERDLSPFAKYWQNFFSNVGPLVKSLFAAKNRRYLIGIIILLVLIVSYTKIKINNNYNKDKAARQVVVASSYDKATDLFTQAKSDLASGSNSLVKFYQARDLAETAKEDKTNLDKASTLIKQINVIVDDKTKTVRLYTTTSYPLASNITKIVLAGTAIYGVNSDNKIYMVDTRDEQPKLVGSLGTDTGKSTGVHYSESANAIFFETSGGKLLSFDISKNVVSTLTNTDGSWKSATALSTYSSNIYLLDSTVGTVWKYALSSGSYSTASDYTDTRTVSLKDARDIAIDGNIFVLKADGTIVKFVKGAYQSDFVVRNIPAPQNTIGTPDQIFTSDTTNSLFVLDKKNNRIIKFDKSGEFNTQYVFDGVKLDSFVVDAKLQKIWGLADGKIYEGGL